MAKRLLGYKEAFKKAPSKCDAATERLLHACVVHHCHTQPHKPLARAPSLCDSINAA